MNIFEDKFKQISAQSEKDRNENRRIIELRDRLITDFTIFRLYEKGMADNDPYVRWGIAESLGALVSVNPKLAFGLYEKGMVDNDPNVRCSTAESLGALVSVNPKLAFELYEKGMADDDPYVRQRTAQSLGALVSVNPKLA
ncbi:MAG: HEAT repeat domain-containing protein, partial [Minisyncoccia bacterium]